MATTMPTPPTRILPFPSDLLSDEDLLVLLLPLRSDYRRLAVATVGLPFRPRAALIRRRLADYSEALRLTLANGVEDATIVARGGRR